MAGWMAPVSVLRMVGRKLAIFDPVLARNDPDFTHFTHFWPEIEVLQTWPQTGQLTGLLGT